MMAFDEINGKTGFANGSEFASIEEVLAYFTPESQREMFGSDAITDGELLTEMAETVITHRWNMQNDVVEEVAPGVYDLENGDVIMGG